MIHNYYTIISTSANKFVKMMIKLKILFCYTEHYIDLALTIYMISLLNLLHKMHISIYVLCDLICKKGLIKFLSIAYTYSYL